MCVCVSHTHTHTHTHEMDYYSAVKRNEILPFVNNIMDLEIILLSEVRQRYMILLTCNLKKSYK